MQLREFVQIPKINCETSFCYCKACECYRNLFSGRFNSNPYDAPFAAPCPLLPPLSPSPPQALQSVLDLGFQSCPPLFLPVCGHSMPVSYSCCLQIFLNVVVIFFHGLPLPHSFLSDSHYFVVTVFHYSSFQNVQPIFK